MPRKNNKSNDARLQAIRARTKELNKKYRAEAARLKELGILTKKVNARKNITRATKTKINKFRDIIDGTAIAVKAEKSVRQKYTESRTLEERGAFLIVPKNSKISRAKIKRGLVEVTSPMFSKGLQWGEEREIILPFAPVNMHKLIERLEVDPTLDGLKQPDEQFAFRLDGWASRRGFVDAKEMAEYIQINYAHWFLPNSTQKVVKYLTFLRFKESGTFRPPAAEHHSGEVEKDQFVKRGIDKNMDRLLQERRRAKETKRKARARKIESESQRKARLEYQRQYAAQQRAKRKDK